MSPLRLVKDTTKEERRLWTGSLFDVQKFDVESHRRSGRLITREIGAAKT
jgi:hypothetical protein